MVGWNGVMCVFVVETVWDAAWILWYIVSVGLWEMW